MSDHFTKLLSKELTLWERKLNLVDQFVNTDMFMISETKLDNSLPVGQFLIKGYSSPFVLDMDSQRGGIMPPVLENIPSNFLTIEPSSEVFCWNQLKKKKMVTMLLI